MPIIAAKCPNCNGEIQLDDTKKSGFCMYCGSQVLVQDAIDLAKVKIDGAVSVEGVATLEKLVQNGAKFLELHEYDEAQKVYRKITNDYPEDYRGWWGVVSAITRNFSLYEIAPEARPAERELRNALQLAPAENQESMKRQYKVWYDKGRALQLRRFMQEAIAQTSQNMSMQENEIVMRGQEYQKRHGKFVAWLVVGLVAITFMLCNIFFFPSWWLVLFIPLCLVFFIVGMSIMSTANRDAKRSMTLMQTAQQCLAQSKSSMTEYRQRLAEAERRLA